MKRMNSPTLLPRLRNARWVHAVQLFVFISWVMNPFPGALSYWTDTNGDGVKEEVANPAEGESWWDQDADGDNLSNAQEALYGSDPYSIDSDHDGLRDDAEQALSDPTAPFDPWKWSSDDSGFSDYDRLYQRIQGYNPAVNYNNRAPGSFFSYSDADGDQIKNPDDSDPLNNDRDNDGILNWNEAAGQMDDATNGYTPPPPVNDPGVMIGGNWYPTGTLDSDGDGTPDQLDPFPWGSFWYQGIEHGGAWSDRDGDSVPDVADNFPDGSYTYNGMEYGGVWVDQDSDGIPDTFDPWPTISGSFSYQGTQYPGMWFDSDNDSIPDSLDPFPWVAGSYSYLGTEYAGAWSDQDNDGVPDAQDSWPLIAGSYWYNGTQYPGPWSDQDNDGIPDAQDNYPNDWWNSMPHFTYQGTDYSGSWADRDSDGVPDLADAYPDDPDNHEDGDNDGISNYVERTQLGTDPDKADTDDDGLTDFEELYTFHTNPLAQKTNPNQLYTDFYMVDQTDTDGDHIPDRIEQWYFNQGYGMSASDPNDARGDLDGDGYTNVQAYFNGWSFIANLGTFDNDMDGILDVLEDAWNVTYPGILNSGNPDDAVVDYDGDGVMNFEEVALVMNPGSANTRTTGVSDLQEWGWRGIIYGTWNGYTGSVPAEWNVVLDNDNSGAPDGLEAFVAALNANPALVTLPQAVSSIDYDGDGMSDAWEHRYNLNLRDVADANANNDGDSLTNLFEFQLNRNPLINDDPPPPTLTLAGSTPNGAVGEAYSATFTADGGTGTYTYSVSGTLPDGLSLDSSSGVLSGTPNAAGEFDFTVQVSDSGAQTATQMPHVSIADFAITTSMLPQAVVGLDYSATLTAVHGTAPYAFSILADAADTGLPSGYVLQSNGTLTGTGDNSTGSQQAGTYTFTVQVADNGGRMTTKPLSLVLTNPIPTPLTIATTALPNAAINLPYLAVISASGGSGGYVFGSSSHPEWLNITSDGFISGTPPAMGDYALGVQVMDSAGSSSGTAYVLTVGAPQLQIVSGDNQIMLEGLPAQPLVVRVMNGSQPVAGMGLTFSSSDFLDANGGAWSVAVVTDANGQASVLPGNSATFGAALVSATLDGGTPQVTFHLSSTIAPYGVGGPNSNIIDQADAAYPVDVNFTDTPRPPATPPVNPNGSDLSDDEVIVQVRWVSAIEVTDLNFKYSQGYVTKANGETTQHPTWGYDGGLPGHQEKWQDSDGQNQGTAGATRRIVTALPWRPMIAGEELSGMDYHDNGGKWQYLPNGLPAGMAALIGFVGGGSAPTVINSEIYAYWMACYSNLTDHRTMQVRLKRRVPIDAEHPGQAINRVFFLATSLDGTNTTAVPTTMTLSATEDATTEANVVMLDPNATQERVTMKKSLLPVEVMQHPADVTSGSSEPPTTQSLRLCRWLDAYDSSGNLATDYPRYDRDRIRIKIPAAPFPGQNKITVKIATKKPAGTNDPEDAATDLECDKIGDSFISKPIILVGDGFRAGNWGDDAWSQVSPGDEQTNDPTHVASPGGKVEIELPLPGNLKIECPIAKYNDKVKVQSYVVRSPSSNARIPVNILTYLSDGIQRTKDIYKQAHIKIEHTGPYDCVLTDAELDLINSDRSDGARTLLTNGSNINYLEDGESQFVFDKIRELDGGGTDFVRIIYIDCDFVSRNKGFVAQTIRDLVTGANKYGVYEGFIVVPIKNASDNTIQPHETGHALKMLHPKDEAVLDEENEEETPELPYMLMSRTSTSMWDASLSKWMVNEYSAKRFVKKDLAKLKTSPRPLFILPFP